ncbi:hypothetical protein ACFPH6_32905 [Streptomyces xiangluensis]|uniref:Uncharacterized protein n=1 Tax=Streptomyces xiangluensis TaxID=2665720 RepID=A0ABV8YX88_9ACTN
MAEEHAEGRVAVLTPLYERLVMHAFRSLGTSAPTVLTICRPEEKPLFEAPAQWPVEHEPTWETLPARATELLASGSVLLMPSWGRIPSAKRSAGKAPSQWEDAVLRSCRPASSDSVLGVLVPSQICASEAPWAVDLREAVAEDWDTLLVVYGHGAMEGFDPRFETAALFLRARAADQQPLKIFRFSARDDEATVENDFQGLLARGGGRTRHGYVARRRPDPGASLAFDLHDPDIEDRRSDLAGFGGVSSLGDLYHQLPMLHLADAKNWTCSAEDAGAVRLLGGRDVGRDGTIAPATEETLWGHVPESHLLAPGDLLVRSVQHPTDPGGFVVAELTPQDLPAAATHMAIPLRPRPGLDAQQRRFAVLFLRMPLARKLVGLQAGLHLGGGKLRALPIPQPDEALAKALDDVTAARTRLEGWQAEADSLLASVFLDKTAAAARSRIIASGRGLRLRVEAASLLDDLGHTVRTRFPYPVASRWRETEAQTSAGPTQGAYAAVLDTTEILLCYTAQLALALAWSAGIELGSATAIKDKLSAGRGGPGFGDWAFVLQEVSTSRKLRALPPGHPLHDLRSLLDNKETAQARQRLSDRRNDQAHLRRIDPVDLPRATSEALADLTCLLEAARFLADWPLLHLTTVRWDALTRAAALEYRELTGDHPVVPTRTMTVPRNDLEAGSLYLRDSDHELHLLRPFLIGRDCPTCRLWSTFHVDRALKGKVILKSLEHGHVVEDALPALRASLEHVQLL